MKNIFLAGFCMLLSTFCFCQEWTLEHQQVLNEYNLNEQDHRGVIFYTQPSESAQFATISEAITAFFNSSSVLDITHIYVSDLEGFDSIQGKTLDIFMLVDTYIQLKK